MIEKHSHQQSSLQNLLFSNFILFFFLFLFVLLENSEVNLMIMNWWFYSLGYQNSVYAVNSFGKYFSHNSINVHLFEVWDYVESMFTVLFKLLFKISSNRLTSKSAELLWFNIWVKNWVAPTSTHKIFEHLLDLPAKVMPVILAVSIVNIGWLEIASYFSSESWNSC